jgi:hypothetical protein
MRTTFKTLLLVALSCSLIEAQNYIDVYPGEGTLAAALAQASDGDVLVLSSGSEYTEASLSFLGTIANKSLTITTDYVDRAIVRMTKVQPVDSTGYFFRIGDQGSLKLENIEFDGTGNAKYFIHFYMPVEYTPTLIKKVQLENCFVHDIRGDVIHGEKSSGIAGYLIYDSTIVNNCLFQRTGTIIHFKQAASNYVSLTNSTISEVSSYGMRLCGPGYTQLPDHTPEVIIDHTTWYKIGTTDPREIILGEQPPLLRPWKVTNSIFANQMSRNGTTRKTCVNIKSDSNTGDSRVATITNCLFWQTDQIKFYSHTVRDTITYDPAFSDPEGNDFTLTRNSIAYHIAGDGSKAIGDLRWATSTNIAPPPFKKLTIIINGNGSVTVDPQPLIIQFYQPETIVRLLAQPDSAYQFASWSGDLNSTNPYDSVTMNTNKTIIANFIPQTGIVSAKVPSTYELYQNYPNPFNASTTIRFNLKQAGYTTLAIYNLLGKEMLRLVDEPLKAGYHQIELADSQLPTGIYFYKLNSGNFTAIKKMVLIK